MSMSGARVGRKRVITHPHSRPGDFQKIRPPSRRLPLRQMDLPRSVSFQNPEGTPSATMHNSPLAS